MRVVLRNPKRELDLPAPGNVGRLLREPRDRARVGDRHPQRHARRRTTSACTTTTSSRSGPSCPERIADERVRSDGAVGPGRGHRGAPPQRGLLPRLLRAALRGAGAPRDRALRHVRSGRRGSWWRCRAARTRSASGSSCASSATRPTACTSGSASASTPTSPAATSATSRTNAVGSCTRSTSRGEYGFDVEDGSRAAKRAPCSACGLSKRHIFNEAAVRQRLRRARDRSQPRRRGGGAVRQRACGGRRSFSGASTRCCPRRRDSCARSSRSSGLSERELAAYCVLTGIDYIVEECPMAVGNRHLGYKNALNEIEERSPGTKAAFVFGFLERAPRPIHGRGRRRARRPPAVLACAGRRRPGDVCAFCRMRARAVGAPDRGSRRRPSAGATHDRHVRGRRTGPARRQPAPAPSGHARRRRPVPHPRRHHPARRRDRAAPTAAPCARAAARA